MLNMIKKKFLNSFNLKKIYNDVLFAHKFLFFGSTV